MNIMIISNEFRISKHRVLNKKCCKRGQEDVFIVKIKINNKENYMFYRNVLKNIFSFRKYKQQKITLFLYSYFKIHCSINNRAKDNIHVKSLNIFIPCNNLQKKKLVT